MPATIHFTHEFIKACEGIWRDGFNKGVNGEDNLPNFKEFFSQGKSKIKEEPSYVELEKSPFNPEKCEARVEKFGYAIQCTRSPFEGGCLCKTHQNIMDKLPEGATDLRYGRFNQPRPEKDFFKGEIIKWGPKKGRSKDKKDDSKPKLKVGEMREFLSSRIPNTVFKGMKKKELSVLYLQELEKEDTSSNSSEEEQQPEKPEQPEQPEKPEQSEQPEKPEEPEKPEKPEKPEQPEEPEQPEKPEQLEDKVEDDGAGTGLSLEPIKPSSISGYKELFDKIGIDYSNIKGIRSYKQAYEDHLKAQEEAEAGEKTEQLSEDDDDDLQEDTHKYDETNFEGVDYLEDEDTAKVYNLKGQHVGKWNEDIDDIIWISEQFKTDHENSRP